MNELYVYTLMFHIFLFYFIPSYPLSLQEIKLLYMII